MEMQTQKLEHFTVLAPQGEIDFHISPELRKRILAALDGGEDLLMDMAGISYIDSSGIACLVEGLQHARGLKLGFALARVQQSAMQVLKLTRLDSVFPLYPDIPQRLGD